MAMIGKVLGQASPLATTETDLYTTPAATQTDALYLVVCNRGGTDTTFRVSVSVDGAATTAKDYQFYDMPITANDTLSEAIKWTLDATDKVRCYGGNANLSFSLYGTENT